MTCIYIYIYIHIIYIYIYICIGLCVYIYIYIYVLAGLASAERSRTYRSCVCLTPSLPTKSLDFRGFDSSRLLILKGGNSHARRS